MKRTELTEMDYKGSGIKTLRGMATLMLILGIIGALSFIPLWSIEKSYHSEINILGIFYSISLSRATVFISAPSAIVAIPKHIPCVKKPEINEVIE